MANFAVAASPETIEKANRIMEMYAQDGDKKEDILLRILDLAESESVKGTHPELEGSLRAVDGTIGVLIKQINGIVAGQDSQLSELKKRLEAALEAKQEITEKANSAIAEAQEKCAAATLQIEQADADIAAEKEKAKASIEKALADRDQYLRARDDAMAIADEKSASNDLLRKETSRLQNDLNVLNEKYADQCSAMEKAEERIKNLEQQLIRAELEKEKAVMAKEREIRDLFDSKIREIDRENAKLQLMLEQMRAKE